MKRILAGFLFIFIIFVSISAATTADYRHLEGPAQWGRSHTFDVQHIKLELSFDEAHRTLFGRATTTIQPFADNFTNLELDGIDLVIESVSLESGRALEFQSYPDRLAIRLDKPYSSRDRITFTVAYHCRPKAGVFFIAPDEKYPNRPHQIWSQGEMEDNRRWFPCYDYPNDKATSELIITVKDNYTAISNGRLLETKSDTARGTKTFHWLQEKPHSSYLISFVVGEYVEVKDQFENIPVSYYVYKFNAQDARRSFGKTVAMIKYFSDLIGYRYPYDKYAQTIVNDFTYGGMENISATTLTDETIHPESVHEEAPSDGLVAHELAHQWWGDLLTCRAWPHIWLNEGFATFFGGVWKEHDQGHDEYIMDMIEHFNSYTNEEEMKYRRPIVYNHYYDPDTLFDRTTYEKGALALNMLRWLLGEERFWRAINHYAHKFEYKNVDTNDFKVAIEEATGEDLDWFFDEWVYKAGYPEFEVTYDWNEAAKLVHLNVKQTQKVDDLTPIFRTPVDIEIVTASGRQLHRIQIAAQEQDYYLPADTRPLTVCFDKAGAIIKKLKFDRPKDQIFYQLEHEDVWGRIEAARELRAYMTDEEAIAALARTAGRDEFWGVRAEAASTLGESRLAAAREALIASYGDKDFKVRRSVVKALGNWRDGSTVDLLKRALETDPSITVAAAAATALGKTGSPRAFDLLAAALSRDSHREVIRIGVFEGFKELKDSRALPLAMKWAEYGAPRRARPAALEALGKLGKGHEEVTNFLIGLLDDPVHLVRQSSASALKDMDEKAAVDVLDRHLNVETDGRVRFAIRDAISRLNGQRRAGM